MASDQKRDTVGTSLECLPALDSVLVSHTGGGSTPITYTVRADLTEAPGTR